MKQLLKSSFVVFSLTFAGLAADATPAIGDKSVYDVQLAKGSQKAVGTMTLELTAYDASMDTWTLVTTTSVNGQDRVTTTPTKSENLISDAMIQHVLTNCEGSGGKTDTVSSPAGTFAACAMPLKSDGSTGTLWVSQVPFGYSQWSTTETDGTTVLGLIRSFVAGTQKK